MISILENFVLDAVEAPDYCHQVSLVNNTTGKLFYDKLGFTYIELLKFDKIEKELSTDLDKWLYAIKHMKTLNSKPASFTDPEFEKLFNLANLANLTKEEMDMYYESQKIRWDNQNALDYAEETGIEQGEHNKAIEIARNLKNKGIELDIIADTTGLSIQEIEKL
ncbi:PD-(D/E)XK nuclease family transposase [compost metagenome]